MLMQVLVRTLDRHEPVTSTNPFLKPSHRTCLRVAGLQEPAKAPSGSNCIGESTGETLETYCGQRKVSKKHKETDSIYMFIRINIYVSISIYICLHTYGPKALSGLVYIQETCNKYIPHKFLVPTQGLRTLQTGTEGPQISTGA